MVQITPEQAELANKLAQLIEAKKETIYSLSKKIGWNVSRTAMKRIVNCEASMSLITYSKLKQIVESYEK